MPWDFNGLSGTIDQKGVGDYYLCRDCNSNTGSWYIEEYVKFANSMSYVLQTCNEADNCFEITVKDIHPLRIYKAIEDWATGPFLVQEGL